LPLLLVLATLFIGTLGSWIILREHDEAKLDIAIAAGSEIIGINNRDLRTLEIDLNNAPSLIHKARAKGFQGLLVAESGYSKPEHMQSLMGLADAVLIGTSLTKSGDLQTALKQLIKPI
jgi:indole-3-glycerol phosphate synthase